MSDHPGDDDGDALARLARAGADLSRPLLLEFAVVAPDAASARAIETTLARHGYEIKVEYDEGEPVEGGEIDPDDEEFGPSWTIVASVRMVPTYDDVVRVQADLGRLATPHGGRSDGWGAMIGPDGESD
jgi:hypothetical protein